MESQSTDSNRATRNYLTNPHLIMNIQKFYRKNGLMKLYSGQWVLENK